MNLLITSRALPREFALTFPKPAPAAEHCHELAPEDTHVVCVDEQVEAVHRLGALEEEASQKGE